MANHSQNRLPPSWPMTRLDLLHQPYWQRDTYSSFLCLFGWFSLIVGGTFPEQALELALDEARSKRR